ncbi:unnamed protein product [Parnassius mnemosyne]|uniref:DDE Tnp4 domain-containing protein n=1 Tax=Parnassius mnemosyne TaxID=213953 RepID=A0AAV1LU46_9NEOP
MHRKRTLNTMEEIFSDLLAEPSNQFQGFVRMSAADFELLLSRVGPLIEKQKTKFRETIPAKIRLAVTLRYLATGDSYRSLHYLFKMSHQVISNIVKECCAALIYVLKDMIKLPENENEWLQKESEFKDTFPHCLGAIDGKHVAMVSQIHSGSEYFNYKRSFSIVLMALVDRNFCFMFCDVGNKGRISDGGVFRDSVLFEKLQTNSLHLPQPKPLSDDDVNVPYVFVADNAFPLHPNIMKPFPGEHSEGSTQRNFNRKLSSVRIVVENAFGVMSARFRVLKKPITLQPNKASKVVMACALLHNFLRKSCNSRSIYSPSGYIDTIVNGEIINSGT